MIPEARRFRPRRNERGQKVHRIQANQPDFSGGYNLTVPAALARLIGPEAEFTVELTDEGLLYRRTGGATNAEGLPDWLKGRT